MPFKMPALKSHAHQISQDLSKTVHGFYMNQSTGTADGCDTCKRNREIRSGHMSVTRISLSEARNSNLFRDPNGIELPPSPASSHPAPARLAVLQPMALAFRGVELPAVRRRAPTQIPSICSAEGPRATRLSLPTFRERRYLQENYVERAKGRATNFAKATAFTLLAWPLVVRELSPEEIDRRRKWLMKQRNSQDGPSGMAQGNASIASTVRKNVVPASELDEAMIPDVGCEMLLEINHDSLLLDTEELAENSLLWEASRYDFNIPPWAYVVRVRAGKSTLGKRAVQRNRAKRRIRAAASAVCPQHACRGREYVFTANPEALTIGYHDLVDEVRMALKRSGCWEDTMTTDMLRREKYCGR